MTLKIPAFSLYSSRNHLLGFDQKPHVVSWLHIKLFD